MKTISVLMGRSAIEQNKILTTILGSCVSICFVDKNKKIAAMTHYMTPTELGQVNSFGRKSGKELLKDIWNQLLKINSDPSKMDIYVFGGGEMFETEEQTTTIGKKNIEFAKQWLKENNLIIKNSCLGGPFSRTVKINPQTGEVLCKKVSREAIEFDGSKLPFKEKINIIKKKM